MIHAQERLPGTIEGSAFQRAAEPQAEPGTASPAMFRSARNDAIRRLSPPDEGFGGWTPSLPAFGSGMIGQLLSLIGELLNSLGFGFGDGDGGERYFSGATASSTGDPHLAFDGTTRNGRGEQARFDSMSSHIDLLQSNSFSGGYRIATEVTAPSAEGVTYNQSASVLTAGGATRVTLDAANDAQIEEDGETFALADNQTVDLDSGETVTRNADGSVIVHDTNRRGGTIATTLSENGRGVDVNVQAKNVGLGGLLPRRAG